MIFFTYTNNFLNITLGNILLSRLPDPINRRQRKEKRKFHNILTPCPGGGGKQNASKSYNFASITLHYRNKQLCYS